MDVDPGLNFFKAKYTKKGDIDDGEYLVEYYSSAVFAISYRKSSGIYKRVGYCDRMKKICGINFRDITIYFMEGEFSHIADYFGGPVPVTALNIVKPNAKKQVLKICL